MPNEEEKLDPPSEAFADAVCDGGSIVADCTFCGRVHFATYANSGDYEKGELEGLLKKKEAQPDKYIEWPDASSVGRGHISGYQVVGGCPCNKLSKYENFIWENRDIILRYLRKQADRKLEDAQKLNSDLKGLA